MDVSPSSGVLKKTLYRCSVFTITFFGYAFLHATRKTFSNVKQILSETWTPTACERGNGTSNETCTYPDSIWNQHKLFEDDSSAELFLGTLDTIFMVSYAVGLYVSGVVGDRFNMRYILTFGLCSSALCVFLFGTVSEWGHVYSIPYYVIFWILNGLIQSTGWPTMVAVMGNWFGKESRGLVFGVWSACASVGNIIGSLLASQVVNYGYEYAFLVPSSVLFCWGVITFFGLVTHPSHVGLPDPDSTDPQYEERTHAGLTEEISPLLQSEVEPQIEEDAEEEDIAAESQKSAQTKPEALGFIKALLLPGVILYSLSYACLKFVNYAFFFWLPYYLTNKFNWTQEDADEISIWYDVGGIVAGIISGFVSDRMGYRAPAVEFMLLMAAPSLYFYSLSPPSKLYNSLLMANAGFWIGGPASLISSAISADLGRQGPLQDNKEALATVAGIVDGTGSVGAAIGQILIPVMHEHLGWQDVFYMFIVMTVLTFLCILPILIKEMKMIVEVCRRRMSGQNVTINSEDLSDDDGPVVS